MKKHLLLIVLNVNYHFDVTTSRHFIRWRARNIAFCSLSVILAFYHTAVQLPFSQHGESWFTWPFVTRNAGEITLFCQSQVLRIYPRMIRQLHLPPDYQILSFISYESYIWVKYVILWTSEYTDIFQEICLRDKISPIFYSPSNFTIFFS